MKKILLIILLILLTGCNNAAEPVSGTNAGEETPAGSIAEDEPKVNDYSFEYNGVAIHMGEPAVPVVEALGEPLSYFEAASCVFLGLDKIYSYNGFELYTFPKDEADYISSVSLKDDSVSTLKGICLGMKLEKVIEKYGDGYAQELGQYTYTMDKSALSFLIEDGEVTAITYNYLNPEL